MNYKKWDDFARNISDSDDDSSDDDDDNSNSKHHRGNKPVVTMLKEGSRVNIGPSGTTVTQIPQYAGSVTCTRLTRDVSDCYDLEQTECGEEVIDISTDGSFDVGVPYSSAAVTAADTFEAKKDYDDKNDNTTKMISTFTAVPKSESNVMTDKVKSQWTENGSKTSKYYWCQNKKEVLLRIKISNDLKGKDISFKYYVDKSSNSSAVKRKLSIFEYNSTTKIMGKIILEGNMRYDIITNNETDKTVNANTMNNPHAPFLNVNAANGIDGAVVDWEVKSYYKNNGGEMKMLEINFLKKCPIPGAVIWWKSIFEIDASRKEEALKKILTKREKMQQKKQQNNSNDINSSDGLGGISFTTSHDDSDSDDGYDEYFGGRDRGSDNEEEVEVDVVNIPGRSIDLSFVDSWNQAHDHIKNKLSGEEAIAIDLDK